ncbi:MAG: DUF3352 domain-containing protein [Prevotellaceae bacterium]|jgi:hypothetical protein|nr:DUF3352 domain-containing protein [Prevotellaceae bacterium]
MKKNVIVFLIITGSICLTGAFWVLLTQPKSAIPVIEITQAVPLDAVYLCCFERADILNETFNNPSSGWNRFVPEENALLKFLQKLQDTAPADEAAGALLQSKAIYSAHPQGKNSINFLFAVQLPPACPASRLEALVKRNETSVKELAYNGTFIITTGGDEVLLHTAVVNNFALFSQSLLVLQNAIRHVNSGVSLNEDGQFQKIMQTSGVYSDVRVFINHRALNLPGAVAGSDKLRNVSTLLPYCADWTALDGQISPNVIHLNGFIFPSFTDNNYLSLLLSQNGSGATAWEMLPAQTAFAAAARLSDIDNYFTGYKSFLDKHKLLAGYNQTLSALNERIDAQPEELCRSFYIQEIGVACVSGNPAGWVSFFKTANPKYVLEQLETMAGTLQASFRVDETMYANPARGLLAALFKELINGVGDTYFIIHDDWFVFSDDAGLLASLKETRSSLKKYIQSSPAAQYCTNNNVFSLFIRPSATDNTELLSYFHPSLRGLWGNALGNDAFKIAGLQLQPSGDKLYTTFFAVYDHEESGEGSTEKREKTLENKERNAGHEHQAQLTANGEEPVVKFPALNHNNKQWEYLVQYADNNIALTGKNGAEQWRQKIDGAIVDTMYQLDFYKNGKLQMLFLTAEKLYLTDRKGNTVRPFPLSLPAAATKLAVFDYDKNKDYRLFVVQGNKVYAYDKKGRTVDGWKIFAPQATITRAPEFFRVGGRDYIVVCDEQTIHILDRRGNVRVLLEKAVAVQPGTPIVPQQQPPALKVQTIEGKTVTIPLKS